MKDKLKIFDTVENRMFVGSGSQIDNDRFIKYDRNLHDQERLSIFDKYKINGIKLPKFWQNYSKDKLLQILKAKIDDKSWLSIVTELYK